MTTKKSTNKPGAKSTRETERKADYSWNSFRLTPEEAGDIADTLAVFLNDAPDEIILSIIVLVNSFTYTRDHAQREYMRTHINSALMPYTGAACDVMNRACADEYRKLVGEGGEGR